MFLKANLIRFFMQIFQDFMKAFLANTYWKIVFVGSLIYEQREAVLPEDTITRKTHHPDFPARRGRNQSQITKTASRGATTTTWCHN